MYLLPHVRGRAFPRHLPQLRRGIQPPARASGATAGQISCFHETDPQSEVHPDSAGQSVNSAPVLAGRHVRLEPLSLEHLDGLCAVGLDESLWQWIPAPVHNREEMRKYIETA